MAHPSGRTSDYACIDTPSSGISPTPRPHFRAHLLTPPMILRLKCMLNTPPPVSVHRPFSLVLGLRSKLAVGLLSGRYSQPPEVQTPVQSAMEAAGQEGEVEKEKRPKAGSVASPHDLCVTCTVAIANAGTEGDSPWDVQGSCWSGSPRVQHHETAGTSFCSSTH